MNTEERFSLARRHRRFKKEVRRQARQLSESEAISTKEGRQLYNWNRQVAGCYDKSRAFARLKISKHGIVYGKVEPEHYVEDMVAKFFAKRFPMFLIMIESSRGTFVIGKDKRLRVYSKKMGELLSRFEKELPEQEILSGLEDFDADAYWERYYASQLISHRKNKKYFHRGMPKKYLRWESLGIEKASVDGNRRLGEF
jgi:probable DNA metabolism protein